MISKNEKIQGFFAFLGFWLTWLFLASLFRFFQFFCFSFFIISFSFFLFLIIFFDFFMISCVLQHFRPKNEGNEMKTWQKLMSYKQSQKNEDKMIQKCKKEKDSKMKSFFVAFFRLRLTWLFSAPIFRFFFHVFFIFYLF